MYCWRHLAREEREKTVRTLLGCRSDILLQVREGESVSVKKVQKMETFVCCVNLEWVVGLRARLPTSLSQCLETVERRRTQQPIQFNFFDVCTFIRDIYFEFFVRGVGGVAGPSDSSVFVWNSRDQEKEGETHGFLTCVSVPSSLKSSLPFWSHPFCSGAGVGSFHCGSF